jgi:hypothetical protein
VSARRNAASHRRARVEAASGLGGGRLTGQSLEGWTSSRRSVQVIKLSPPGVCVFRMPSVRRSLPDSHADGDDS